MPTHTELEQKKLAMKERIAGVFESKWENEIDTIGETSITPAMMAVLKDVASDWFARGVTFGAHEAMHKLTQRT